MKPMCSRYEAVESEGIFGIKLSSSPRLYVLKNGLHQNSHKQISLAAESLSACYFCYSNLPLPLPFIKRSLGYYQEKKERKKKKNQIQPVNFMRQVKICQSKMSRVKI
jgi:hypothetical protein